MRGVARGLVGTLALVSVFCGALPRAAHAMFVIPTAHLTINATTDGPDETLHFETSQLAGIQFEQMDARDLQTSGGSASYDMSLGLWGSTTFMATETVPQGKSLDVHCTSDLDGTVFTYQSDGVAITAVPNATISCTFNNTTPQSLTPVILIPGIMGSMPHNDEWVIDPITHGFDNLIATLKANGYTDGVTLFTFPYDWHKSNVDTAALLKGKIDQVKQVCGCDKVDLVAHSMGGLVARQYIQSSGYGHDVRNLIFLGTPQLGSPKAYLMWAGGENDLDSYDQQIRLFLMLKQ